MIMLFVVCCFLFVVVSCEVFDVLVFVVCFVCFVFFFFFFFFLCVCGVWRFGGLVFDV